MNVFIFARHGKKNHFLLVTNLPREQAIKNYPGYEFKFELFPTEKDRSIYTLPEIEVSWTYR